MKPKSKLDVGPRSLQILDPDTGECHNLTRDDLVRRPSEGIVGLSSHDSAGGNCDRSIEAMREFQLAQLRAVRHHLPPDLYLFQDCSASMGATVPEEMPTGKQIEYHMKKCGWSPERLALEVQIHENNASGNADAKLVRSHIRGERNLRNSTKLRYSQIFTKERGVSIEIK